MDNFNHTQAQPYYNTIMLDDKAWKDANNKAIAMQKIVEKVFLSNPGLKSSGWLMKRFLEYKLGKYVNINSVRRCLSNLKEEQKVVKLPKTRIGEEGTPEHFYALKLTGNEPEFINKKGEKSASDFANEMLLGSVKKRDIVNFDDDSFHYQPIV